MARRRSPDPTIPGARDGGPAALPIGRREMVVGLVSIGAAAGPAEGSARARRPRLLTSWWPFGEGAGTTVSDGADPGLVATLQGDDPAAMWHGQPGLSPDGRSHRVVCNPATEEQRARIAAICDLSSMVPGRDHLVLWGIVSHPAGVSGRDGQLWSYGSTGEAGWGLQWNVANCVPDLRLFCPGGTPSTASLRGGAAIQGRHNGNTRTAWSVELVRSETFPGWFEATLWKRALLVDLADIGQPETRQTDPLEVPSGTGLPGTATVAAMTWFAQPTVDAATFGQYMPAATALCNFGIQRRARVSAGIGKRIVDALAALHRAGTPYAFPEAARE